MASCRSTRTLPLQGCKALRSRSSASAPHRGHSRLTATRAASRASRHCWARARDGWPCSVPQRLWTRCRRTCRCFRSTPPRYRWRARSARLCAKLNDARANQRRSDRASNRIPLTSPSPNELKACGCVVRPHREAASERCRGNAARARARCRAPARACFTCSPGGAGRALFCPWQQRPQYSLASTTRRARRQWQRGLACPGAALIVNRGGAELGRWWRH